MSNFKLADNVSVLTDFADGYTVYDARYALVGHTHAFADHGALTGLGDDDHSQYALLAGRSGGQALVGGTASGDDLMLQSTSHGTKGHILFGTSGYDEVNNRLGIGTTTPRQKLEVAGALVLNSVTVGNLSMNQVESLANNGVAAVASTSVPTAMIFIIDNGGSMAIYQLQGGVHATTELVDASGNYTTVAGTAGKYNIYWSGANGRYEIENKSGSTRSFRMLEFYS